ncbi:MAG: hypothetical protein H7096_10970 [Flavobacterium sp.]|nr:hypothetical protein [Pedobacter sp.]
MMTKQEIESNVTEVLNNAEKSENSIEQFSLIWQGTIKPALSLVKLITGKKIDKRLDQLEVAADGIGEATGGQGKFCLVYSSLQIKTLLKTIQIFTGPKVDLAVNKFIGLSDEICNDKDN